MMWLINKILSVLQDILPIMFVIVLIAAAYGYVSNEDYNDIDSVTVTYSCKTVRMHPSEYPPHVASMCFDLVKEAK